MQLKTARIARELFLCAALVPASHAPLAWAQSPSPGMPGGGIELTRTDLFLTKDWDSKRVRILGLHIGMPRERANSEAIKQGLTLNQHGVQYVRLPCSDAESCQAYTSQGLYTGIRLRFGREEEVVEIVIERAPEYADPAIKRANVTRSFKGQTYELFNGSYSNELRLRLFGPETSHDQVSGQFGEKIKDTRYTYTKRGVTIRVSPEGATQPRLELDEVSFCPPD